MRIIGLIFFVLIEPLLSKSIRYDSALGYECTQDSHCSGLVPNSMCWNDRCACRVGYKADGILRCVQDRRQRRQVNFENAGIQMLGEECGSNDQCRRTPVDGSKACFLNQCQCSPGYVPIDAYRCIPDFEQISNNKQVTRSVKVDPPGYGSICTSNADCHHPVVQLECTRGSCACLEGYVPLGKYLCYSVDGHDQVSMETSTSTESTTLSTVKQAASEMDKDLGRLGKICTTDYYCRRIVSQSHCYNGKCTCLDGFIASDSFTCVAGSRDDITTTSAHYKSLLGGQCSSAGNCQTIDARCLDQMCTCPTGYFAIDDWNCFQDPDASHEELTTTTSTSTSTASPSMPSTSFRWWPWSSSTTSRSSVIDLKNTFRYRCLLNRQCVSMDQNSHCTLFGRCICNDGFKLVMTNEEQRCLPEMPAKDNCD